jgi:uncharacterized protein HemX
MSFLLAEVAFLLALAILCGGFVGWWLQRRRLVEQSQEHQQLQEDWGLWRRHIERRLAEPPVPDWTPMLQRLGAVEKAIGAIRFPSPEPTNLRPVLDAIASVRMPEAPAVNLEPLNNRLLGLEDAIGRIGVTPAATPQAVDLSDVLSRLASVESCVKQVAESVAAQTAAPQLDLSGLHRRLDAVERQLARLQAPG